MVATESGDPERATVTASGDQSDMIVVINGRELANVSRSEARLRSEEVPLSRTLAELLEYLQSRCCVAAHQWMYQDRRAVR